MFDTVEREAVLVERKLAEMKRKTSIPQQVLDLVDQVQRLQTTARGQAFVAMPPEEDLATLDRVDMGAPLLPRERFLFDAGQAAGLFARFAGLLAEMGGPMAQAAVLALEGGEAVREGAFAAFLASDEAFFSTWAAKTPQAPRTLAFLAQSSLTPSVMALAGSLAGRLPAERTWGHGHCPICGSLPFHSVFTGKEGFRMNSCSFCRATFRAPRLQCAYCLENTAEKLPFFFADEEPGYRIEGCLSCNHYIKTTDFREFDRTSLPALDDLESLTLDILAAKRGFTRPTTSAWGF